MAAKPTIRNLILQPCCKRTLQDIANYRQTRDELTTLLGGTPFALIVVANADSNDWDIWMEAMKGIPVYIKRECRNFVQLDLLSTRAEI